MMRQFPRERRNLRISNSRTPRHSAIEHQLIFASIRLVGGPLLAVAAGQILGTELLQYVVVGSVVLRCAVGRLDKSNIPV
jgi:hypothetical protein